MNRLILTSLLALPILAGAQINGAMSEAQMQHMMQNMESMQSCMENIDQTAMQAFQDKAAAMETEVKALCASGKRDAAMARAAAFGKEAASNQAMREMQKCGEGMKQMMPRMAARAQQQGNGAPGHICDAQ